MSKRYELLKDMPDAKAGTIVEYDEKYATYSWGEEFKHNGFYTRHSLLPNAVENNPSWFKEVVGKEWEIECFTDGKINWWLTPINGVWYHNQPFDGGHRLEFFLSNRGYSIYTVKRIGDGEVFSIGDRVELAASTYRIQSFKVNSQNIMEVHVGATYPLWFMSIKKATAPTPPTTLQDQDKFQWTDELVEEFANEQTEEAFGYNNNTFRLGIECWKSDKMRQKKSPSQPQNKERIEVTTPWRIGGGMSSFDGFPFNAYRFNSKYQIPDDKFPAIKQAIESIINS